MNSVELEGYLNKFNKNINNAIREYGDVSNSIASVTDNVNTIKGSDSAMFEGMIDNNLNAKKQIETIINSLEILKVKVNTRTNAEINRLERLEEAARKEEGGNG
ncbi:MAG: hypothetical protein J6X02_01275 [Bacilli bacterium]|nr:hypothetical protein [Bacilli bacterium]